MSCAGEDHGLFESVATIQAALSRQNYIVDRALATTLLLAYHLKKPIMLEGEAGVGKTEVAKVLAQALDSKLIRLQCYEGLDANHALYEWNYPKQLLRIRLEELIKRTPDEIEETIFSPDYLLTRPLLEAITLDTDRPPVLLIDEIDRADEEFEAFLLELLSDFQITIPEIGTIKAKQIPLVVLTSNRTRELHDAIKRRCLYLWIPYPNFEKEMSIARVKLPDVSEKLAAQVCSFVAKLRTMKLVKKPGIAETLDWLSALTYLNQEFLDRDILLETIGCVLKSFEDIETLENTNLAELLGEIVPC